MSRLEVPITGRFLWHTGDLRRWVDLDLFLKDRLGRWRQRTFRMDTASDLTTMAASEAKRLDLPLPPHAVLGALHRPTGLAIRSGLLRFRIRGPDAIEYALPCLFLGDPDAPPNPSAPATVPRRLLQPFQLIDQLRFVIDQDPHSTALYGTLTIEQKVP